VEGVREQLIFLAEMVMVPVFEKAVEDTAADKGKLDAYIGFVTFNVTT
jgi:hypothetical protein